MQKKIFNTVFILTIFFVLPNFTHASPVPVLNFSDIDSGPKTGNTDGVGSGAIVTIWGNYLGSTQGASKIYVGDQEATAIYYWKNADGQLPGGPADLFTYHKMQEIAFAIPANAPDGATTIKVVVGGVETNTLPFTVRSGNIYFIKPTGNDSTGDGSWGSPWATLQNVLGGGNGKVVAGDTIYSIGVGSVAGLSVGYSGPIKGTQTNPVSLVAYPNTTIEMSGHAAGNNAGYVINNWWNQNDPLSSEYLNFSKLNITAAGSENDSSSGIRAFKGNRIVGVEITGPTVYGGYSGAIGGNHAAASGGKYYGVYIHNYGTDNGVATLPDSAQATSPVTGTCATNVYYARPDCANEPGGCTYANPLCRASYDGFQHLYYLSNRDTPIIDAYEIAWNNLIDNPIWQGIHIYDQGTVGGWNGTMKIHHNVVKNQRGGAIETAYPEGIGGIITPVEIYNNIVVSDLADTYNFRAFQIRHQGPAKVYNNTTYGYNSSNVFQNYSTDYKNNIMVDSKGVQFIYDNLATLPNTQGGNLFYSTGATPKPIWATPETGNLNTDPLFLDSVGYDFSLQTSSPAKTAGSDATLATAPTDFFGQPRPAGNVSIGAIQYVSTGADVLAPAAPTGLGVV